MKKRYTVTVYVAVPGTPLTKEDGSPLLLPEVINKTIP